MKTSLSAHILDINFVRLLRGRALIGLMVTVVGTSLGAAAAAFNVGSETAVYVGAFGFAFVLTLGSRFLFAKKVVAAGGYLHHSRTSKNNSTSILRGYLMLETKLMVFGLKVLGDKEVELNAKRAEKFLDHFAHAKSSVRQPLERK